MRRRILPILLTAMLAAGATGCRREQPVRPVAAPPAAPMPAPMVASFAPEQAGGAMAKARSADATDRRIAYTESYVLEMPAEDVAAALRRAADACNAAGGSVLRSRLDRMPDGSVQASLSVRIPPDKFQAFASGLVAPPARLVSHAENAEDKTIAVLDIERRLAAQTALRDRLTNLLNEAKGSVTDLVAVEKQLADVQGQIESMTAQRDYLRTITDTVRVEVSYTGLIQQAGPFDLSPIRAAVDDFARAAIGSAGDMITWVATALPWVPVLLIGLWILRLLWRRR
ncbi:MAG: DUF4349 domain-containing protein [Acetobacteraceae bacterium]